MSQNAIAAGFLVLIVAWVALLALIAFRQHNKINAAPLRYHVLSWTAIGLSLGFAIEGFLQSSRFDDRRTLWMFVTSNLLYQGSVSTSKMLILGTYAQALSQALGLQHPQLQFLLFVQVLFVCSTIVNLVLSGIQVSCLKLCHAGRDEWCVSSKGNMDEIIMGLQLSMTAILILLPLVLILQPSCQSRTRRYLISTLYLLAALFLASEVWFMILSKRHSDNLISLLTSFRHTLGMAQVSMLLLLNQALQFSLPGSDHQVLCDYCQRLTRYIWGTRHGPQTSVIETRAASRRDNPARSGSPDWAR